jgi:hypothetical protein
LNIQHNSPIIITIGATLVILIVLALILSGGSVEGDLSSGKFKISLNSLGSGIKSLRESLQQPNNVVYQFNLPFCLIKFNDDEISELYKSTKGNGGFQSYLTELQHRTWMKSVALSIIDIERISRYKKHPKAGGFQKRFYNIFNRHF